MKVNLFKHPLFRGAVALLSLLAILVYAFWPRLSGNMPIAPVQQATPAVNQPAADGNSGPTFGETIITLLSEISAQEKTEELILGELRSGAHSAKDPLILDNPYGCSPLTALAVFTTDEPARVFVRVHGKTSDADISHDFPSLETEHLIPIYGLYADDETTVTLTTTLASGQKMETTFQIQTDAIDPNTIGNVIIQTDIEDASAMSDGVNFLYTHKLAFDAHGDIRWTNNTWVSPPSTLYDYEFGTYITTYGSYLEGNVLLTERNFLGKFLRVWYSPYGVHHDIEAGSNGNLLVTGSKGAAIEDFVYELDANTGEIVHTLDLKTVLPRSSERINTAQSAEKILSEQWGMSPTDWFHLNAIVWDDGDVILSGRHSSAVVKMAWPSGTIQWILASPDGWLPMDQKYLLTSVDNQSEFEWPYWQHAPYLLPDQDGNPGTEDILLFDNGTVRFGKASVQEALRTGNLPAIQNYSRLVQYRIDENAGTIEQVWQYGKERGEELYTERCGNADLLANGNRLGFFFIENDDPNLPSAHIVMNEVDPSGKLIWEALITNEKGAVEAYRGNRMPLYRDSDQNLQLGVPTRVLIPKSVLAANGVPTP
ncbi:MAG: aryl-sulfate sulfotransferase [Clostridiaceae bacterium]